MSDKGPRWGRPRSPPSPPIPGPQRPRSPSRPHCRAAEPPRSARCHRVGRASWSGGRGGGGLGRAMGIGGAFVAPFPPPQRVICRPRGRADLSALPQPPQLREAAGPGGGGRQQTDAGAHRGGRPDGECPHIPPPYPPPVCLSVPNTPCSSCRQPPMLPPGSAFPWLRSQGCVEIVEVTPSARSRPLLLCICNVNSPPHTPHTPPLPYFLSIFSHRFPVPGIQAGAIGDASAGKLN